MMMKFACKLTEKYHIPTTVSMNPIMIDGTGMCGVLPRDRGGRGEIRLRGRPGL